MLDLATRKEEAEAEERRFRRRMRNITFTEGEKKEGRCSSSRQIVDPLCHKNGLFINNI
jgi:hypothetical protein